jgi:Zn-dependent M28 family amino/carboxypeptidase
MPATKVAGLLLAAFLESPWGFEPVFAYVVRVQRLASFESSFRAASDVVSIARASLKNAVAAAESPLSRFH